MKVDVFDLSGKSIEKIDLPSMFNEQVREDLIKRSVLAIQSNRRQPYGTDPMAGKRTSVHYHGRRHRRYTMVGRDMSRVPRLHGTLSPHLMWRVRRVPQARGGRVAHPPKVEKIWSERINKKERQKAIRSAIAATAVKDLVVAHGHRLGKIETVPIVVDDKLQGVKKVKDVKTFLEKVGLSDELERISQKKIRAGRGTTRGRKYKKKVGPLIIVTEDKGISKAVKSLSGVNVCHVINLNAEYLAPGAVPGRLTVWTKSAIKKLGE